MAQNIGTESTMDSYFHQPGESNDTWRKRLPVIGISTSPSIDEILLLKDSGMETTTQLRPSDDEEVELYGKGGFWYASRVTDLHLKQPLKPGDRLLWKFRGDPETGVPYFRDFDKVMHANEVAAE
jgi:hypothetical protein